MIGNPLISLRQILMFVILTFIMFPIAIVHSECGPPMENMDLEITGTHFISQEEGWAVGYDTVSRGGILLHCRNSVWSSVDIPEVSLDWTLNGIHLISSDEGWAVGQDRSNKRGVLLHHAQGTWTATNPPEVSNDWKLNVVRFDSVDEGWAAGYDYSNESGILLRYSKGLWIFDSGQITLPAKFESAAPAAITLPPSVTTASYSLSGSSARLNGLVNLHRSPGNWWFEVNGDAMIYHSVPSPPRTNFSVSETFTVNPDTAYSFRVCANNAAGQTCGQLKSFKTSVAARVATPTFNPAPKTYPGSVKVAILCFTRGATIRYTTDGSDPNSSSSPYSSPLTITSTTTLKAKAFKSGMIDSDVASGTYNIGTVKVATPTFSPAPGTYQSSVKVAILCFTRSATIRYTTDGSDPDSSSSKYSSPLTITSTTTLKVKAFKSGMIDSDVASGTYNIGTVRVATPTFNPAPKTYQGSVKVAILCFTRGATIRYTTDGSDPNSSSSKYSSPLTITYKTTLKAKAFKSGMIDSDVASATYDIGGPKVAIPTFNPAPGTFSGSVIVNILCETNGARIRYTTDGTPPNPSSSQYHGSLTFTSTTTLKARGFKNGLTASDVASGTYTKE